MARGARGRVMLLAREASGAADQRTDLVVVLIAGKSYDDDQEWQLDVLVRGERGKAGQRDKWQWRPERQSGGEGQEQQMMML